jgi:hypothetical protein
MARKQAQDLADAKNYAIARNAGREAGVAAGIVGPVAPALARVGGRAVLAARGPAAQAAARAESIAKYVAEGSTPEEAVRLAMPYRGMGHHSVISRAAVRKNPDLAAAAETPFSRISGRTMETGEFYKLHARLDKSFRATKGWNADTAGVDFLKNPPLRMWEGTPLATKVTVFGGAPASAGLFQTVDEDERLRQERGW